MRDKLIGKLRCFQAALLVFFIIHGGMFGAGVNLLLKIAHEDAWIAGILGSIIGFIPFYLFVSFATTHPDGNIFESMETLFGKIFGKIISIIITLFVISFILIYFWNLTNLISSQYLYKTPQLFIYIIFAIPLIYLLLKGIKITLRSITIIFFITTFLYAITFFSLIPQVHFDNVLPILKDGIPPIIEAALGFVAYCISPLIFINAIPVHYYEDKENYKKYMIISYIISSISINIVPFLLVSIFGIDLAALYQYPEFQILRRVSIGGFIERVESTLSIQWIFELFVLVAMGMYFIKQGVYHIFHVKKNYVKTGLNGLFLIIFIFSSLHLFENNTGANEFTVHIYPFVCYGFLLIFGVIYLFNFIQKKRTK